MVSNDALTITSSNCNTVVVWPAFDWSICYCQYFEKSTFANILPLQYFICTIHVNIHGTCL